jgi:hypothetical protein
MITTGAKLYLGFAALALVAAVIYGWGSTGGLLGPVTGGLTGGIGDHTGYITLLAVGLVSLSLGVTIVAFRDADSEVLADYAQLEQAPEVDTPQGASYWPIVGAVAAGLVVVGAAVNTQLFLLGCIIGGVVLLEWMVSAWSDRATGDPATNRRIRNRIMYPLEIPVFGAIGIVVVVLCLSRVLLALSKNGAVIAGIVVSVLILGAAVAIAASPKAGRTAVAIVFVLGAVGVLASGVIAAVEGERTIHPHEEPTDTTFEPPDRNQPVDAPLQQGGATQTPTSAEN